MYFRAPIRFRPRSRIRWFAWRHPSPVLAATSFFDIRSSRLIRDNGSTTTPLRLLDAIAPIRGLKCFVVTNLTRGCGDSQSHHRRKDLRLEHALSQVSRSKPNANTTLESDFKLANTSWSKRDLVHWFWAKAVSAERDLFERDTRSRALKAP